MNPTAKYRTVCRVPGCGQEFFASPFEASIIGAPNDRLIRFVEMLIDHLQQKHPAQLQQISGAVQEYFGFLTLMGCECQDPHIAAYYERVRASIARASRRLTITDEEIQDRIARLGLDPEQEEGLQVLLRDMRDLLTEQGRYAPQNGQPRSLILTA